MLTALSTQTESRQKDRRHHCHLTNGSCQARAPCGRGKTQTLARRLTGAPGLIWGLFQTVLLSESQPSATIYPLLLLAYYMPDIGHTDLI